MWAMILFLSDLNSKNFRCHRRSLDTTLDLRESSFARRGSIISKGRETAIVGRSQRLQGNEFCRFEHAIAHLFRTFNFRIYGVRYTHEKHLTGLEQVSDRGEHSAARNFAGQLHIESADLQAKQFGQETRVVHVGAMRGVMIAAGASMHPNPLALSIRESVENAVVQVDKCFQHSAGGIKLQCQPPFGEVDLHTCTTSL